MKNEDKLKLAKKKQQDKEDIVNLLIAVNTKLEKIIEINKNDRIITVRGMQEVSQTLKEIKNNTPQS